jgi:hypothetical protein
MVQGFGLPQIFYTMTMAENHWSHLHNILLKTDNKDPLPSNRPFHTYLHYHHRLTSMHQYLWKNPNLTTGKSFIIQQITNFLTNKKIKYLLMAPTGVAAQNINGQTIHSALHIRNTQTYFKTLSHYNNQQTEKLRQIKAIIIDEVSMVSSTLLSFISLLFAKVNRVSVPFGGIPTLLIGDKQGGHA